MAIRKHRAHLQKRRGVRAGDAHDGARVQPPLEGAQKSTARTHRARSRGSRVARRSARASSTSASSRRDASRRRRETSRCAGRGRARDALGTRDGTRDRSARFELACAGVTSALIHFLRWTALDHASSTYSISTPSSGLNAHAPSASRATSVNSRSKSNIPRSASHVSKIPRRSSSVSALVAMCATCVSRLNTHAATWLYTESTARFASPPT